MKKQRVDSINSTFQNNSEVSSHYRYPSLINDKSYAESREINNIDNEEQIPIVDFQELFDRFNENAEEHHHKNKSSGILRNNKRSLETLPTLILGFEQFNAVTELRRTYSETEKSMFDLNHGKRFGDSSTYSNRNRVQQNCSKRRRKHSFSNTKVLKQGIEDEYIPGLTKFDFESWIGEEFCSIGNTSEIVSQLKETKIECGKGISPSDDTESRILSELHSQVKPIEIKGNLNESLYPSNLNVETSKFSFDNSIFQIAGSPERQGDKLYLASLPSNFTSLSFSDRKRSLNNILPPDLQSDQDYKKHLSKLIRKSSVSKSSNPVSRNHSLKGSSTALRYLNSFSMNSTSSIKIPREINEYGSIVLGQWKLGKVIGRGAFGIIRECINAADQDDQRAMKIISIFNSADFERRFKTEILMWSLLEHKNILKLHDFALTPSYFFVLMPLIKGGSLLEIVQGWHMYKIKIANRINKVIGFLLDIANGLKHMHDNGLFHGDLKLENCIVDIERNDKALLCDFGMCNFYDDHKKNSISFTELSKQLLCYKPVVRDGSSSSSSPIISRSSSYQKLRRFTDSQSVSTSPRITFSRSVVNKLPDSLIGSLPYASPEILQPIPVEKLNNLTDIWAFGVLLFALITLNLPFSHNFEPRLKLLIMNCDYDFEMYNRQIKELPQRQQEILTRLLKSSLEKNYEKRIDINEILCLLMKL